MDSSMIVRYACAGEYATLLAKPPTDAPSFVLVLTWTGTDWIANRECHNDVLGVADCLADLTPTLVDELALVGETYPRDVSEIEPSTWAAECSAPLLTLGDTGVCVAKLQTLLAITGADLDVDGSFGRETEVSLLAFQDASQLEADGLAGPVTWATLVDAIAPLR
jgi:peptidoglycan hydrolase-like protein with peptidoglycan-binding domain